MDTNLYNQYIDIIKKQYDVENVWSFSRVNSFKQDPYGWFLRYIKHEPSDKDNGNAYGIYGNMVHDIMEDYYKGIIAREDCAKVFDEKWQELSLLGLKFNNTDEESEKRLKDKYYKDILSFMNTFETIDGEHHCEQPVAALLENKNHKEAFFGYIDFLNKNNNHYQIIDYKTSTMYKGSAIEEHAQQLLLYAVGLKQKTQCEYNDITIGWNFLKYVLVKEEQKNGNIKDRYIERYEVGLKLENSLKKWMKEFGYEDTNCIDYAVITNDFSKIPTEVMEKFSFHDCIITVEFNETVEKLFIDKMLEECYNINKLVEQYNETEDDGLFMWEPSQRDEFYYYNLCDYSTNLHKAFAQYFSAKEQKESGDSSWLQDATDRGDELSNFFANF